MVWVATHNYSIDGHDFTVRSTDAAFLELVDEYVGSFRVDSVADAWSYSADCGIKKTLAGGKEIKAINRLYVGGLKIFEGRVQDEMAGRLLSTWRDVITAQSNEFIRVRAAAVEVGGSAVVMPSAPEPHLPTLAGLLTRAGAGYLGDELVNLDPIFRRIHGISLPLLVDGFDLGEFPNIQREPTRRRPRGTPEEIQARTPRRPIPIAALGRGAAGPAPLGWLVFPTFSPDGPTELLPIGRAEAMFRLTQATLNLHIWNERALLLMQDLIAEVPCEQLLIGSLQEATSLLFERASSLVSGPGND